MKKIYFLGIILLSVSFVSRAQEQNPYYQSIVDQIDIDLLHENLETHVGFGSKQPGTDALIQSFNWLKSTYENWGYTDIAIDTFYYTGHECYNLIVTKTGVIYPDIYLIVDGHYDTRNGPGANDNGTGTAIVLECARLLKDVETDYSIRFIHFSAEEVGLIGSNHYVDYVVVPEDHQIKLVFNIDAVGGVNGMNNDIIICEQDESYPHENDLPSSQFTDTLAVLMEMYSDLSTEIDYAYATDYVPFMEEGYIITGLYEYNQTPYAHTPNDVIENMDLDYFYEVAKGSIAASLYFSGAHNYIGINESLDMRISVYPNPTSQYIDIYTNNDLVIKEVIIFNQNGSMVYTDFGFSNERIDLEFLPNGLYFLTLVLDHNERIVEKISKQD